MKRSGLQSQEVTQRDRETTRAQGGGNTVGKAVGGVRETKQEANVSPHVCSVLCAKEPCTISRCETFQREIKPDCVFSAEAGALNALRWD